ncbi:MAG: response regulator [Pseudomonadota bacterium]
MARILIIDDDHDMVDSLSLILKGNGYQVEALYDTADLSVRIKSANPDLILLDVMFPDDPQAGFKAARLIAKDRHIRHLPVLILSAVNARSELGFSFTDKDISDDYLPVGGFLEKPVEPQVLLNRIRGLLHQNLS